LHLAHIPTFVLTTSFATMPNVGGIKGGKRKGKKREGEGEV